MPAVTNPDDPFAPPPGEAGGPASSPAGGQPTGPAAGGFTGPPPGTPGYGPPPPYGPAPGYGPPAPYGPAPPYGPPPYGPYGPPPGYGAPYGYAAGPTNSGKSVAVLILGISSLVLLWLCGVGVIAAIVALVMAPGAKREIEQSGGRLGGLGLVTGGQVTSWITIGLAVIGLLGLMAVATTGGFEDTSGY